MPHTEHDDGTEEEEGKGEGSHTRAWTGEGVRVTGIDDGECEFEGRTLGMAASGVGREGGASRMACEGASVGRADGCAGLLSSPLLVLLLLLLPLFLVPFCSTSLILLSLWLEVSHTLTADLWVMED